MHWSQMEYIMKANFFFFTGLHPEKSTKVVKKSRERSYSPSWRAMQMMNKVSVLLVKEAIVIPSLMFWCVKAAAVSWHSPRGADESLQLSVLRLESSNRCFVFTLLPGHLLIHPLWVISRWPLLPLCTRLSMQNSVVTQHAHIPPALLAFQRWP